MKRRMLSLLLVLSMLLVMLPASVMAAVAETVSAAIQNGIAAPMEADGGFGGGDGTAEDPYLISDLEELEAFRDYINAGNGAGEYFKQTADIDLSPKYGANIDGEEVSWQPIGYYVTYNNRAPFSGTYDGGGFTVSGLYINASSDKGMRVGLFGNVGSGTVKNLNVSGTVIGTKIPAIDLHIAGVVGFNDWGTVQNCTFSGSVTGSGTTVGGTVGWNYGGTVDGCRNSGTIAGTFDYAGGVAGQSYGDYGLVQNCSNTGNVSVDGNYKRIGGIVGYNQAAKMENCYNSGKVTCTGDSGYAGGIVADTGSFYAMVQNCYNVGEVTYTGYSGKVGGIAGYNLSCTIQNCYNAGTVLCNGDSVYVGGVVGFSTNSTVQNCHNVGTVSNAGASGVVGGIAGANAYDATMKNCYSLAGKADAANGSAYGTVENVEVKDEPAFASGEVAWLLQNPEKVNETFAAQSGQVWGQKLGTDKHPVLLAFAENADEAVVYAVTFKNGDETVATKYANHGGTVEVPDTGLKSYQTGMWTLDGSPFSASTVIEGDTVVTVGEVGLIFEGEGTEESPYLIPDLPTLEAFRDYVNDGYGAGEYFKQTADIDLSETYGEEKASWAPIGFYGSGTYKSFAGTYDGGEFTVSGLYINANKDEFMRVGLFGYLKGGTVKNLNVSGTVMAGKADWSFTLLVGGVVGYNEEGTVQNCSFSGSVTGEGSTGGGVVGYNIDGTVDNCRNSGAVSGSFGYIGGVVGWSFKDHGVVQNCWNSGSVSTDENSKRVGGIVGYNQGSKIENCYNTGDVTYTGSYGYAGGIAGETGTTGAVVKACYNTGNVTCTGNGGKIGGIAGGASSGDTMQNCYNAGTVTYAGNSGAVGGLVGYGIAGTIENSHNAGNVNYSGNPGLFGGIVGQILGGTAVTNCYFLAGTADAAIGNGAGTLTNVEMKSAEAFASGEVLLLLIDGAGSGVWGQRFGTDEYPVLLAFVEDPDDYKLFKVIFKSAHTVYATKYANRNGTVSLPEPPAPQDGYVFYQWVDPDALFARFDENTPVTRDMEIHVMWRSPFGGEGSTIETVYNEAVTQNLDDWMEYAVDISAVNKFTYSFAADGNPIGASISGSTLTVPAGVGAGTYTLTVIAHEKLPQIAVTSVGGYDYGTGDVTLTVTVVIEKAELTEDLFGFASPADLVYDGGDKTAAVTVKSGYTGVGALTVKYYKDGKLIDGIPNEVGTYTVKIDVAEGDNYKAVSGLTVGSFVIRYLDTPAVPYAVNGAYTDGDGVIWVKAGEPATIQPAAGYTISAEPNGVYTDALSVSEWTSGGTIYLKDGKGHLTDAISVTETVKTDGTAPTGEIRLDERSRWQKVLHPVAFGLFFKAEQQATVTSQDGESGVRSTAYFVSDKELTDAELAQISDWQSYNEAIRLAKDGKYVVYVKITDNVGNVTYLSSDGIVIYTDAEAGTAEIEYAKTTKTDVAATVRSNGNTVGAITIDKGASAPVYTVSGEAEGVAAITFAGTWLDTLEAGEYLLTVSYRPQGVDYTGEENAPATTTIKLTVKMVGDKSELEALIEEAEALEGSDYAPDTWAALEKALEEAKAVDDDADASQSAIDEAAAALKAAIEALRPLRLLGDVDGNGAVNSIDYMLLKRYVLGTYVIADDLYACADINRDGKVDSIDYMLLKRFVLGTYHFENPYV